MIRVEQLKAEAVAQQTRLSLGPPQRLGQHLVSACSNASTGPAPGQPAGSASQALALCDFTGTSHCDSGGVICKRVPQGKQEAAYPVHHSVLDMHLSKVVVDGVSSGPSYAAVEKRFIDRHNEYASTQEDHGN